MKRILILAVALALTAKGHAQEGMEAILQQIARNNKALQANTQLIASQKLESKATNNLANPTLSYSHLWDSDDKNITVGELVISQSFDFPSLYATRNRVSRLKSSALDALSAAVRLQVLLQAQQLCLDIVLLHQQQQLLDERLKNAEELAQMYAERLKTGDTATCPWPPDARSPNLPRPAPRHWD